MEARFLAVVSAIGFSVGLIYFWNWIGKHFTDAPAQAVFGLSSTLVGMVLFMIVFYGGWFILSLVRKTISYIVRG
jgi:uncharacterized membrane protein